MEKIPVKIITKEEAKVLFNFKNKPCKSCSIISNRSAGRGCQGILIGVMGNKKTGKIVERVSIDLKTKKKKILYRDYEDKMFKHLNKEKDIKERNLDKKKLE